ncbi:C-terminal domain on Strawberry notch homologue [Sphingomonas laterariae]|uniref:C-terminal domain on Strawberry notch homologue n=1 Tax=Edaphosphingomonas laterariae TaxID=861865 RepID=A0A239GJK8_9SPHN|nr:strawberry notch family protein [Sphingomonas laterariae]SNS69065.1 C-terminal domain on Strawberry notch homologue [Sphingomonas laterariae]
MTISSFAPACTAADHSPTKDANLHAVAVAVADLIERGGSISRQKLTRLMEDAFGKQNRFGTWSMRDAYDSLEAGQVLFLRGSQSSPLGLPEPEAVLADLIDLERRLPTQTYRSEHQVDMQQFSTPAALAWLTALAARIDETDIVLEPSAGTGMLLPLVMRAGAVHHLNERDPGRAALLARIAGHAVTTHDGALIDDCLPGFVRPSVILINPPFSRSEGRGRDRHAGARHLRSALVRLQPGGRCVAILPSGFSADGTGRAGYASVREVACPRVEIDIRGDVYAKHGTSTRIRILVFDKGWVGTPKVVDAETLGDALRHVLALPDRLEPGPTAPPPSAPALPPTPACTRRPVLSLFARSAQPRTIAPPERVALDNAVEPIGYSVRAEPLPMGEPAGIFAPWRLSRIEIPGAADHPDTLVESLAMASVLPPVPSYRPAIPARSFEAVSTAQLEAIIQAGDAFERNLPGRYSPNAAGDQLIENDSGHVYRQGFFIGDGTGVGKGREAAASLMDQWFKGRRRHVWISLNGPLLFDARRDWSALGGLAVDIQPLDAIPLGEEIGMSAGILFLSYSMLRSVRDKGPSRLDQILAWLGDNYDGLIVFDESHALANAAPAPSEFGDAVASQQGIAGLRLQNALPRACVLYVSATGATTPANLGYAHRLGLWGVGTAFPTRGGFCAAMEKGGIAAMEVVCRDLKATGLYTARSLSYAGIEYDPLEHSLTPAQIGIYDAYADAWTIVHGALGEVLKATNVVDRISGETLNGQALGAAMSRFESGKQRFFSQLLISMKMPSLIRAIEEELGAGHVAVVQLVSTAEALLERRLASLTPDERANPDLELSPREMLVQYLTDAFPTRMMEVYKDNSGEMRSRPRLDDDGNPVLCQEAIRTRDALIERLCAMPPIGAALDELIRHFGPDRVAEVTGRSRRIITDAAGRQKVERLSPNARIADADAFMAGRKPILVFSGAGGTGRSYHADRNCGSAAHRRVHFLLEPGWRASAAIQGLGRTHRTNQTMPPIFRPVTTNCKGERRFISTIARRLDALGALTRGQRQAGSQNLFDPADNLESDYARDALLQWYHLLADGKLKSTTIGAFEAMTGLKLVIAGTSELVEKLPPIQRWLNRLLALRIAVQDAIFEEFFALIEARIDAARDAGTLDLGVETFRAKRVELLSDIAIHRDAVSGAETRLQKLALQLLRNVTSFERLMAVWSGDEDIEFLRNNRSGRVALRVPSWSTMDDEGAPVPMCRLVRPTGEDRVRLAGLARSFWQPVTHDDFQALWEDEARKAREQVDVETIHIATGLLLPVWDKLPEDDVRVWRIVDEATGDSRLGRIVSADMLARTAASFEVADQVKLTPADMIAAAAKGDGAAIDALDGARLVQVRVNGQPRLEIRGFPAERLDWLKSLGAFTEIISFRTRLFLPPDTAEVILERIAIG